MLGVIISFGIGLIGGMIYSSREDLARIYETIHEHNPSIVQSVLKSAAIVVKSMGDSFYSKYIRHVLTARTLIKDHRTVMYYYRGKPYVIHFSNKSNKNDLSVASIDPTNIISVEDAQGKDITSTFNQLKGPNNDFHNQSYGPQHFSTTCVKFNLRDGTYLCINEGQVISKE